MEGPPFLSAGETNDGDLDELSGILPRTAEFLLKEVSRLKKLNGREFGLEVSSIEVYCDTVKDLYGTGPEANDLNLITVKDKVVIQGQTWKRVETLLEFLEYIKLSSRKRIFSSNGVNEHSSRSHHIFQVKIAGQNARYEQFSSILNIIDLAGSERRSGMANLQK